MAISPRWQSGPKKRVPPAPTRPRTPALSLRRRDADPDVGAGGLKPFAGRLTSLVERLRARSAAAGTDTVDELDLLLADLVARVEHNDPMTAEHCRAVSAWCARIAHRLSLTRSEASFAARGGLIHDVGSR